MLQLFAVVIFSAGVFAFASDKPPNGWQSQAVRAELAPRFWVEPGNGSYALGIAGKGTQTVDGRWVRSVPVSGGKHYQFSSQYQATAVENPARSILARLVWKDAAGNPIGEPDYPVPGTNCTGGCLTGTYQAPAAAASAQLELHLRWTSRGEVLWRGMELKQTNAPERRVVRLAAINHRPAGSASPQVNLEQFARLVDDAAAKKADIVCLPEGITVVGTGKKYADVAEPIPGPSTRFLGERAAKHRLYLVAGLYERDGSAIYNTSVLIGRDGRFLGKYRKVCLPREEIDGGITPGTEYPVFDTDFGRIGMMICWDLHFPEVARELARKGAEVIFLPIWGGNETLAQARAIENQLYLVASGYDFKTAIYDKAGKYLAETAADPAVILTEIDLNERLVWPWLGEWRARIWSEAPARE